MGDSEIVEKPPEVADISSTQRYDGHERRIELNPQRLRYARNHDPLGFTFAENDKSGEVKLWMSSNSQTYILARFRIVFRQCQLSHICLPQITVELEVAYLRRLYAAEDRR